MDAEAHYIACFTIIAKDGVVKHAVEGLMFREGGRGKGDVQGEKGLSFEVPFPLVEKIYTELVMHKVTGEIVKWEL